MVCYGIENCYPKDKNDEATDELSLRPLLEQYSSYNSVLANQSPDKMRKVNFN